jgi:hypothetical protein
MSSGEVSWAPELVALIENSIRGTSWEVALAGTTVERGNWTMTHGDWHAGNMLWRLGAAPSEALVVLDVAMAGVGRGPTDLAQFIISNVPIPMRRQVERDLLRRYWDRLVAEGVSVDAYSFAACYHAYQKGGIERWLQLLILLASMGLPAPAVQWFHDQVHAFVEDHRVPGETYPFLSCYPLP